MLTAIIAFSEVVVLYFNSFVFSEYKFVADWTNEAQRSAHQAYERSTQWYKSTYCYDFCCSVSKVLLNLALVRGII